MSIENGRDQSIVQWIADTIQANAPHLPLLSSNNYHLALPPAIPTQETNISGSTFPSEVRVRNITKRSHEGDACRYPTPETYSGQKRPRKERDNKKKAENLQEEVRRAERDAKMEFESWDQETPRPVGNKRRNLTDLDIASASSSASTTSKRSRNSSPTKSALLHTLPNPITLAKLRSPSFKTLAPEKLQRLYRRLEKIEAGFKTVPKSPRVALANDDDIHLGRDDICYDDEDARGARSRLGRSPSLEAVDDIVAEALECSLCADMEAGWNSSVHGPLLNLAKCRSEFASSIDVKNRCVFGFFVTRLELTPSEHSTVAKLIVE